MGFDIEGMKRVGPKLLARDYAGVVRPDDEFSPGALFLKRVRDQLIEAIEDGAIEDSEDTDSIYEWVDQQYADDERERLNQYGDLFAWRVDIDTNGDTVMDQVGRTLDQIAEEMSRSLMSAFWSDDEDEEEDDEDYDMDDDMELAPAGPIPGLSWVAA